MNNTTVSEDDRLMHKVGTLYIIIVLLHENKSV